MSLTIPSLADFGVSPTYGFLSSNLPLTKFSNKYYESWDDLISKLPSVISLHQLHDQIQKLPILETSLLITDLEYQRAYTILAFLIHAYIRNKSKPIPPQLSDPFLTICEVLGLQPVLSYAGLCLWNWVLDTQPIPDQAKLHELHQLNALASFIGTRGEDAFYHVPVLIEAEGGPLIPLLLDALLAAEKSDIAFVTNAFEKCAETFVRMGAHLPKMYPLLDAKMFYHELRPFLSAGEGILFEKIDGSRVTTKYVGGSAAQSSLFQFLDLVLGVEHRDSVFEEMRLYMPGKHREFLELVAKLPSLREFVEENQASIELLVTYEDCMNQLRSWRSKHIAVVSKYIVQPARVAARNGQVEASGEEGFEAGKGVDLQGTGGSALIPFLRQSRNETVGLPSSQ